MVKPIGRPLLSTLSTIATGTTAVAAIAGVVTMASPAAKDAHGARTGAGAEGIEGQVLAVIEHDHPSAAVVIGVVERVRAVADGFLVGWIKEGGVAFQVSDQDPTALDREATIARPGQLEVLVGWRRWTRRHRHGYFGIVAFAAAVVTVVVPRPGIKRRTGRNRVVNPTTSAAIQPLQGMLVLTTTVTTATTSLV